MDLEVTTTDGATYTVDMVDRISERDGYVHFDYWPPGTSAPVGNFSIEERKIARIRARGSGILGRLLGWDEKYNKGIGPFSRLR